MRQHKKNTTLWIWRQRIIICMIRKRHLEDHFPHSKWQWSSPESLSENNWRVSPPLLVTVLLAQHGKSHPRVDIWNELIIELTGCLLNSNQALNYFTLLGLTFITIQWSRYYFCFPNLHVKGWGLKRLWYKLLVFAQNHTASEPQSKDTIQGLAWKLNAFKISVFLIHTTSIQQGQEQKDYTQGIKNI